LGQAGNQIIVEQFTKDGNFLHRTRSLSPIGETAISYKIN